ncbi:hypothetical protein ES708_22097 [subsurface metagenome]
MFFCGVSISGISSFSVIRALFVAVVRLENINIKRKENRIICFFIPLRIHKKRHKLFISNFVLKSTPKNIQRKTDEKLDKHDLLPFCAFSYSFHFLNCECFYQFLSTDDSSTSLSADFFPKNTIHKRLNKYDIGTMKKPTDTMKIID